VDGIASSLRTLHHQRTHGEPQTVSQIERVDGPAGLDASAKMFVLPFQWTEASDNPQGDSNDRCGNQRGEPQLRRQGPHQREKVRRRTPRSLVENSYSGRHERLREGYDSFPLCGQCEWRHSQVSSLQTRTKFHKNSTKKIKKKISSPHRESLSPFHSSFL
jgi:hypothetical protein